MDIIIDKNTKKFSVIYYAASCTIALAIASMPMVNAIPWKGNSTFPLFIFFIVTCVLNANMDNIPPSMLPNSRLSIQYILLNIEPTSPNSLSGM